MSQSYAVVIEQAEDNFSANVPDLPDCVAMAATRDQVPQEIGKSIAFHLEGLVLMLCLRPGPIQRHDDHRLTRQAR